MSGISRVKIKLRHLKPAMDNPKSARDEIKFWSSGQRQAFELLREMAEAFYDADWPDIGLHPRLDPLIAGPSGEGKSFLVRELARSLEIPIMRLTYNEWLVSGSKEAPHTLTRLHNFVEENARGLIHIDELDKFKSSHTTDWSTAVHGELLLALDRSLQQPTRGAVWTPFLQAKFRKSFLIIGSGTWQLTWSESVKPKLGFQTGTSIVPTQESIRREIERRGIIPAELYLRFNPELVLLPPAKEDDYRRGAVMFKLDEMARELGVALDYANAVERGLGARWLEETFAKLVRLARKQGKRLFPTAPPPEVESSADIPQVALDGLNDTESDVPF